MLQEPEVQVPGATKPDFLSKSVDPQYHPGAEVWTFYFGPSECKKCDPCGVRSEEAIVLLQLFF